MKTRFRFTTALTVLFAAGLVWFVAKDVSDRTSKQQAYVVMPNLGGQVRSLPCSPFGDEIVITFQRSNFSKEELDRLTILKSLIPRNAVMVFFCDTSLGKDDMKQLRQKLPKIVVKRIVDRQQMDDG